MSFLGTRRPFKGNKNNVRRSMLGNVGVIYDALKQLYCFRCGAQIEVGTGKAYPPGRKPGEARIFLCGACAATEVKTEEDDDLKR